MALRVVRDQLASQSGSSKVVQPEAVSVSRLSLALCPVRECACGLLGTIASSTCHVSPGSFAPSRPCNALSGQAGNMWSPFSNYGYPVNYSVAHCSVEHVSAVPVQ